MSWNVMVVTGIDLLWDLRIDLKCQRGLRRSYRMQTGALILVTMSWIYHQTCSGGAIWGEAAMYIIAQMITHRDGESRRHETRFSCSARTLVRTTDKCSYLEGKK